MNYYEVVPLTYLGSKNDSLTYQSKDVFEIGQAVLIQIRNKKLTGIIIKKTKKPGFSTKEIIRGIFDRPVMSQALLKTAKWISDYYACSLTSVFSTMLPVELYKERRVVNKKDLLPAKDKPYLLTPDQKKVLSSIEDSKENKPHLIFGITGSGKT